MRIFCRFTSKRRFVAAIEWLRLFPEPGCLLQITQTLDTAAEYSDAPRGGTQGSPAGPLLNGWRDVCRATAQSAVFAVAMERHGRENNRGQAPYGAWPHGFRRNDIRNPRP